MADKLKTLQNQINPANTENSQEEDTVKSRIKKSKFRPTPSGTIPPSDIMQTQEAAPIQESSKQVEQTLPKLEQYGESLGLPEKEQTQLNNKLSSLQDSYQKAIDAYRAGADRVQVAQAIEKISQGLALWGAGAYGKKYGVDAVSGLKFSPTDWSTQMSALEKELNSAEKQYSRGVQAVEEEQKTIRQEKKEASRLDKMIAAEQAKEAAAQEKMLRTATVGDIQATIKDMDTQVKNIDNALNQMKTAQFGKLNDAEKENALLAAATGAGVPIEAMRKEKGILFWKGQKFDEDTARQALVNKKATLQKQKDAAQNRLLEVRSGGQVAPSSTITQEPTSDMIKVRAGGRIGQIPRNQFDAVKQKYPDAEIIQ